MTCSLIWETMPCFGIGKKLHRESSLRMWHAMDYAHPLCHLVRDRVIYRRTMLDDFVCKMLIVNGCVGYCWFWLDLIQAVSLTAKLQSPDGNVRAFCFSLRQWLVFPVQLCFFLMPIQLCAVSVISIRSDHMDWYKRPPSSFSVFPCLLFFPPTKSHISKPW